MKKVYRFGGNQKLTTPTKSEYCDDMIFLPYLTVYEEEDAIFDTGILDQDGHPIHYTIEREPIGYIRREEE